MYSLIVSKIRFSPFRSQITIRRLYSELTCIPASPSVPDYQGQVSRFKLLHLYHLLHLHLVIDITLLHIPNFQGLFGSSSVVDSVAGENDKHIIHGPCPRLGSVM